MSHPILFLDIDGVLNTRTSFNAIAQSNTILPVAVASLNCVIEATDCKIVLISAWRYMIHGGAMTLAGFEYLLRTHGIHCAGRLIDITRLDHDTGSRTERGEQVREWMAQRHPWMAPPIYPYVIIDNDDLGYDGMPFVKTNENIGMTIRDALRACELLRSQGWNGVDPASSS